MNFMSVYANIYNSTRLISKFFLFYLPMCWSCAGFETFNKINLSLGLLACF